MDLGGFLEKLKHINTGAGSKPHKFILLLAVIQLIENGQINKNRIYYNDNLKTTFTEHFKEFARDNDRNRPYNPFFHLRSSGFWFLVPKPNKEENLANLVSIGGPKELLDNIEYAYLDNSVYQMLLNPEQLEIIKNTLYKLSKREMDWSDQVQEEREQYIETSFNKSLFQHEENAIHIIRNSLRANGQLLNNIYLYERQTNNYYEYDIVLIGHSKLYVIELKHWSGKIQVAPHNWIIHGTQYRPDPHKNNSFKCKILKGIYQHQFRTYPDVWIESIVVLTNPDVEVEGANSPASAAKEEKHNVTFSSIGDLLTYIKKCEESGKHILNDIQIQNIADYLQGLNQPGPGRKYTIPGYETVEHLIQRPQISDAFSGDETSIERPEAITLNAYLKPGDTYDMYEIIEFIGEGREAQIYKARNGRLETVALKLFNREIERERIFREGDNTAAVKSAYVVGCNNTIGHWKDDRYFLILEYVQGESMRSWIKQQRVPDEETFRNIAMCLLQGVQAFHNHIDETGQVKTILHSDIKPDNILITRNKKAVIIDFGIAGPPRVDVFQGTLAYIPPDSLSGADMQFSEDGDLFALGITLWEWLCGQRPYDQMTLGAKPYFSPDCLARVPINLQECLMKAIALERENRFLKVEDMIEAFRGTKEIEKPDTQITVPEASETFKVPVSNTNNQNPFVLYLNSLSNTSAGNENATAEAQIGNIFFPNIRVEHPASQFIYRQLFTEKKHVILTGNAGDGKTTIAAEIYRRHFGEYKPLLAREESSDLVMIKDLSELPEKQRTEIFSEAMEHPEKSYLIVSNTGTLIENLSKVPQGRGIEKSQLLMALESDHPLLVGDGRFLIVNIGRINSISAALSVGKRMLEAENWQKCSSCSRSKDCTIHINVNLLQENIELVLERIGLAYRRLYEYGSRLTMRQMTGHLAYIITAGLNCEDVKAMSKIALEEQYIRYLFFNRFFGDDGKDEIPEAMQLLPVRKIHEAELGIYLDPFMERSIWKKQTGEMQISENIIKVLEHISGGSENSTNKARIQVRRLLYFLLSSHHQGSNQYLSGFLQSPMLLTYLKHVEENKPFTRSQEDRHLRFLLQVLQECFAGVRLLEDEYRSRDLYITLNPPGYSTTQMILGKAHSEEFSLGTKNIYDTGEIKHRILTMRYQVDKAELELDLPFLDYVARRYRGEVAEELSVFYMDRLQRFKIKLLENLNNIPEDDHMELLSIAGNRSFEIISIKIDDDNLEVIL